MPPFYNYTAINQLALSDTGHFVYLDAWAISCLASILAQGMPLYYWEDNQNPLTQIQSDDLEAKLAATESELMQTLVGLIMPICTEDIPEGTLLCDGTTYNRVDYPNLYQKIANGYKIDDDTFNVPDMRDRFILGASDTNPAGSTGGSDTHTMTESELVPHSHTNSPHVHTEGSSVSAIINGGLEAPASAAIPFPTTTGATSIVIDSAGGGEPFDIKPPFLALRFVVVAL